MQVSDRRILPRKGLPLTAFGLGCAQMGGLYKATSYAEAEGAFIAAWDAGIRYFDTAPYYGYTRSERRLGTMLAEKERRSFIVSTKAGRLMVPDATIGADESGWVAPLPFRPTYDYSYDGIWRSFEDSLQRLGLAHIDILYVHDIGRVTHGDQHDHYWSQLTSGGGFRALNELRDAGAVDAIGLGVNEWEVVADAMQECDLDCTMLAGRYTLLEQADFAFLDECVKRGHAIVAAGPFNSGVLAGNGKFNYGDAPPEVVTRVQALAALCEEFAVPLQAAALQFPLAHPAIVSVVSGARNAAQVVSSVAWFNHPIPADFWDALRTRNLIAEGAPLPGKGI